PALQGWAFRSTFNSEAVSTHEEPTTNSPLPLSHFGSVFDCQSSQRVVAAVDKILDEMKLHTSYRKYSSQQPTMSELQLSQMDRLRERTTLRSLPSHRKNRSYLTSAKFGRQKSRVQKIIDEFLQSARARGLYDRSVSSDQGPSHTTSVCCSEQVVTTDAFVNYTPTSSSERAQQTSTCWHSPDINLNLPLYSPEIMRSWEHNYEQKSCQMNQSASPDLFEQDDQGGHEFDPNSRAPTVTDGQLPNGYHLSELWRDKQSVSTTAFYCTTQPSARIYPRWSDSKNQPVRPTPRWLPMQNCELDDQLCSTNVMNWKALRPSQFSSPDLDIRTHSYQPSYKWTQNQTLDHFNQSQPCGYQQRPWGPNRYEPFGVYVVRNYATESGSNYAHSLFNHEEDRSTAIQSSSRNPLLFKKADVGTPWGTQLHCVCCRFNGRSQGKPYQEVAEGPSHTFSSNEGNAHQYYHDLRIRNTSTCDVGCQYQPIHYWSNHADKTPTIWSSNLDPPSGHTTEKRFHPRDILTVSSELNRNNSSPMHATRCSSSPRSERPSSCFAGQTDSTVAQLTTVVEDALQDRRISNHNAARNCKQALKRKFNEHTRPNYSIQRLGMQINGSDRGGLEKVQNELQTASAFYATPKDRAPRPRSNSPPEPRGLTTSTTHHCIGTAQQSFFLGALATSTPCVKQTFTNQDNSDCVDRHDGSFDRATVKRSGEWCCGEHVDSDQATLKRTKSNKTEYSLSGDQFQEKYCMRVEE
ncbi:hypothetical protein PHET_04544, partial [Paragonimus heterotremus]